MSTELIKLYIPQQMSGEIGFNWLKKHIFVGWRSRRKPNVAAMHDFPSINGQPVFCVKQHDKKRACSNKGHNENRSTRLARADGYMLTPFQMSLADIYGMLMRRWLNSTVQENFKFKMVHVKINMATPKCPIDSSSLFFVVSLINGCIQILLNLEIKSFPEHGKICHFKRPFSNPQREKSGSSVVFIKRVGSL